MDMTERRALAATTLAILVAIGIVTLVHTLESEPESDLLPSALAEMAMAAGWLIVLLLWRRGISRRVRRAQLT